MARSLSDTAEVVGRAVPKLPAARNGEESDNYPNLVARLGDDWRVIVCRDNVHWILQRRAGTRHGEARWEGRSYLRRREVLMSVCRSCAGPIDPAALAVLDGLPENMGGSR